MIAALLLQRMSAKRRIITDARAENRGKYDMNTCGKVCCRTCLGTDDLVLIFRNCDEEKMSHNLKLVTGLEVCCFYLHQELCFKSEPKLLLEWTRSARAFPTLSVVHNKCVEQSLP